MLYYLYTMQNLKLSSLHLTKFHISSKLIRENWHLQSISWLTLQHKSPFLTRAIKTSKVLKINIDINQFPQFIQYIKPPWIDTKSIMEPIFSKQPLENLNSMSINYIFGN